MAHKRHIPLEVKEQQTFIHNPSGHVYVSVCVCVCVCVLSTKFSLDSLDNLVLNNFLLC